MTADAAQAALVDAWRATLGAPTTLVETHISRLVLGADRVWKFKRPVTLPFVDYAPLAAREHFCEEELRLNRRLAPDLYLEVLRLPGDAAVVMRRFPDGALWSERLAAGTLTAAHVDRLAARLGAFHLAAAPAPAGQGFGSVAERRAEALDAVRSLAGAVPEAGRAELEAWFTAEAERLAPLWAARQAAGHVRECHGDLHLRNLLAIGDEAFAFDGIEFSDRLRFIDIADDIAFVVMDLQAHGRRDFAFRLLDGWLAATGDHPGLPALRFAMAYRATVRAEVSMLQGAADAALRYAGSALAIARRADARLLVTHGLPGAGKTTLAGALLEAAGAVRLRSDVERKRLVGLDAKADSRAAGLALYGEDLTERTYAELLRRAAPALDAGWPVILDAAYLRRAQRDAAATFAADRGLPFAILDCAAPLPVLRRRVAARQAQGADASEADIGVLEHLHQVQEPLAGDERARALVADSTAPFDAEAVDAAWRRCGPPFTTR